MEQRQSTSRHRPPGAKTRSRLIPLLGAAAVLLACACGSGNETSRYWNLPPEGWPYADTLIHAVDSGAIADIAVVVRHAANYEYSNLWVELSYSTPSDTACVDTFNIILADDFGRWQGHGLGVGLQYADTLLRGVALRDSTALRLRHIMRADTLQGIEQIGIVLIPAPHKPLTHKPHH